MGRQERFCVPVAGGGGVVVPKFTSRVRTGGGDWVLRGRERRRGCVPGEKPLRIRPSFAWVVPGRYTGRQQLPQEKGQSATT